MRFAKFAIIFFSLLQLGNPSCQNIPEQKYTLVLFLSIDQLRYDYLTRFQDLFTGGFRTLLHSGAVFTNARYHNAVTETGPGHATLATGRYPSHSGAVANHWYDSNQKKGVNVVDDPDQRPVGGEGRGASPVHLIGDTIGDALKQHSPETRVIGLSMKDRSAVLMAGHLGDGAFWYDSGSGKFITSTYYMKELPGWLEKWNNEGVAKQFQGHDWNRLMSDSSTYDTYAGPDAEEGESDRIHTTFPHPLGLIGLDPAVYYRSLWNFTYADEMTLSLAMEAIRANELGTRNVIDLLAIGFSATDSIGHIYGPQSQELMDQLLRLDGYLGRLFAEIDSRIGLSRTLIVLSSDHGVMPLVETLQKKGIKAQRINPEVFQQPVQEALEHKFPTANNLIAGYDPPHFYLNLDQIRTSGLNRADVENEVKEALMKSGLVEAAYSYVDLEKTERPGDSNFVLFHNNFFPSRTPHVFAAIKPYIYVSDFPGGTGHGTQHDYDRHVPIIFMGEGIRPGSYDIACGPHDIAPTIASLLGLPFFHEPDSVNLSKAWH